MRFDELNRFSELLGYYEHDNEGVFKLLANELETARADEVVKKFKNELNQNLLEANSYERKRDIIAHYIFEFQPLLAEVKKPEVGRNELEFENEFGGSFEQVTKNFDEQFSELRPNEDELNQYYENALELGQFIFQEIQISCFKFKVDFDAICDELKIANDSIDTLGYIYYYLVARDESSSGNYVDSEMPTFIKYREKLLNIEKWAKGKVGLLDNFNHWDSKPKKYLAALISLLKDRGIISPKRGENPFVNEFFFKRYNCDFPSSDLSGYKPPKYKDAKEILLAEGFDLAIISIDKNSL